MRARSESIEEIEAWKASLNDPFEQDTKRASRPKPVAQTRDDESSGFMELMSELGGG